MHYPKQYSEAQLREMTEQLRQHRGAPRRLITDLGKAKYAPARDAIAAYLLDPDGFARSKALITLAIDFHVPEYEATARTFLRDDPDDDCKLAAISVLGYFEAKTRDPATLALLAATVHDTEVNGNIRTYAYETMHQIVGDDFPVGTFTQMSDVDWAFVDRYRQL